MRFSEDHSELNPRRLAIVGLGALGSEVCTQLISALAQTNISIEILLIDPDLLHPRNIPASTVYQKLLQDMGRNAFNRYKVDLMAKWLPKLLPAKSSLMNWKARHIEIADCGWNELKDLDLLITCTDNASSRVEAAFVARMLSLPMIDGGVMGAAIPAGRVAVYSTGSQDACYLCGLSQPARFAILTEMSAENYGCETVPEHRAMDSSVESSWSIRTVASALVERTLALLASSQCTTSFEIRITSESEPQSIQLNQAVDCPWHSRTMTHVQVNTDSPLAAAIPSEEWCLVLPWAIAMVWTCIVCGYRHEESLRLGYVRRKVPCPRCSSSRSLTPERILSVIHPDNPYAQWTPRQLGLPERHLLLARKRMQPISV